MVEVDKWLADEIQRRAEVKRELLIKNRLAQKKMRMRPREKCLRKTIRSEILLERRECSELLGPRLNLA